MPEVASATITVTPVLEGAQQSLTDQMTQAASPAGAAAGKSAGQSMMSSMGNQMTSAGTAMTKYVTAPIAAVGTAAVAAWKEVDTGFDTIIQKTGASGEELESMRDILSNIATSVPTDFATAGSAIGEVNTRFGLTGDALEELSTKFIKFADLNDQDVSNSVDSVSKMMAAMGVEAEDAGRMLDALNVVGQQTGVDVGTLSDTVAANAVQFKEMGLSAEDSVALLGSMSMAGLDSSTAMMGLKTAMKNATEDGISMQDALVGFEGVMNSNASESDKLAAAYELFGTRAGGAIYNAVSNGTLDLANFTSSLGEFEGSVDETFAATQDPIDEFTLILNQLKDTGAEIVEAAGPLISDVLGGISEGVNALSEAWSGLSPEMQEIIIKIAGIAAIAGPLILIGGKIIGGISSIAGGIGGLVGKIGGLTGAAGEAVGPVASAGGSFSTLAGGALNLIALGGGIALAALGIKLVADAAVEVAAGGPAAIGTFFGMAAAIAGLMGVAALVGPALTAGALGIGIFGLAVVGIGGGIALATYGISLVIDAVGRLTETIAENAPGIVEVVSGVGETISGILDTISGGIVDIIDAISGGISGVLESVSGVITSIGDAAVNAGSGFETLVAALKDLTNNTSVFDLGSTLTAAASGIKDINKAAGESETNAKKVDTLATSLDGLESSVQDAASMFTDFQTTSEESLSTAEEGADNLANGFATAASDIETSLEAVSTALTGTRTDLDTTESKFSTFSVSATTKLDEVKSAVDNLDIAGSINSVMNSAISTASARIGELASMFANTRFSFYQHIALPHFSMSGSFDAKTKSVPTVSAHWYAKAAEYGALFTKPQIIGVGDASQPELLLGEEKLKELVRGAGQTVYNITVDGAESPEIWARKLVRAARQYERIM